jgi:hypothetical protein
LTNDQLAEVLSKISTIRAWANAIEAEALGRVIRDGKIPGYKLVEGRSNRVWGNKEKAQKKLLKLLSIDEVAPRDLISPAQVETLLKKAKRSKEWDTIAHLVTRPPGKLAIAQAIDPRPELTRGSEFENEEIVE